MGDLENQKIFEVSISLSSPSELLVWLKSEFKKYADELEWIVEVDKKGVVNTTGNRVYPVQIIPREKKISAEEIRKNKDLILGFVHSIYTSVLYRNRSHEQIPPISINHSIEPQENGKDFIYLVEYAGILSIKTDLKKAIELEREDENLAKAIFLDLSISSWYNSSIEVLEKRFSNKKERKDAERLKIILDEHGISKQTPRTKKWRFDFT